MPVSRPAKRSFQAPFKAPFKDGKQEDDFESLSKTPCTPATDEKENTPSNSNESVTKSNKRTIKQADFKASTKKRKSARFKTPVPVKTTDTVDCGEFDATLQYDEKSSRTDGTKNKKKRDFATPQQLRKSARMKTPVSENTQSKLDFDSLETTPLPNSENTTDLTASSTPAIHSDKDFDSLGNTPSTEKIPADKVEEATLEVGANDEVQGRKENDNSNAGRCKRKRKQTDFFGDVKDSSKAEIMGTKSASKAQKTDSSSSESESSEKDDSKTEITVPSKRRTSSQRRQTMSQNVYQRRSIEMVPKNDRFLQIHEVAYHPSLAKHRGWETDGVRAWVKPHPLPLKINANFTEQEIQAARNFSPGPPVCPWLVRSTCHGRYPLDEMAVRIALEMRRSFQLWFKKERRIFERGLAKQTLFITAMRINIIPRTDPTLRHLFCKIYFMGKHMKFFSIQNFVDCLDLLAEIVVTQYWHPRTQPIVEDYIEKVASKVLRHMDDHRFSPLYREIFKRNQIPYSGKGVIPRGSKVRVVQPGCGPPFLTPKEFERKFGVSPRIRTDEELTRSYDSVGNVIGHFTVPNLRELLTPITQQVEESIEKEERPGREKKRKIGNWMSSERPKKRLWKLKKRLMRRKSSSGTNNASSILERIKCLVLSKSAVSVKKEECGGDGSRDGQYNTTETSELKPLDQLHPCSVELSEVLKSISNRKQTMSLNFEN
ncbi:uncharacterized protein LOC134826044 [Bolinopsis microptera]|uniref:uncharacterized protein LOC134826044 n=1 Tax=Bolinopsis microptera TaxID=2820187 RepID=UPI00307A9118